MEETWGKSNKSLRDLKCNHKPERERERARDT